MNFYSHVVDNTLIRLAADKKHCLALISFASQFARFEPFGYRYNVIFDEMIRTVSGINNGCIIDNNHHLT